MLCQNRTLPDRIPRRHQAVRHELQYRTARFRRCPARRDFTSSGCAAAGRRSGTAVGHSGAAHDSQSAGFVSPVYSQYPNSILPSDLGLTTGVYIPGYKELDVTQVQTTATKLFGPTFGADQFTMVGEVGVTHVHNMPSKDKLRFDSPDTYVTATRSAWGPVA